jgi:CheY-like chemotaxis protein
MSHELRTPLNAILGFTQLMDRDQNLTAGQRENLGIINRSGEHLLALINDVLEMSKIEAGRVTLQESSFDLYRLLDGLEEMFDLRAKDTGLSLSFERAENVPKYVRADEAKLRQILSNLLGNAVKFTQEGTVTLRVGRGEYGVRRGEEPCSALLPTCCSILHFEVEDTGPGIGPEELVVLFDPFVQATSGQRSQEGTGLGLSISQQYVRLMGGDITVSSGLGHGSVFKFDIEVKPAEATDVQAERPVRQVIGLEPGQAAYRLLIVDERPEARQLLVKLLEPLGFELREALNGREGIEMWERWEPHLIWMDMRMPVMDGYEATRRIKATTKGRATTIVALTATAFEEDRERVLSEGCDDFVRKPFREDEIFDTLTKHLGVRFVYEEIPLAGARSAEAAASSVDALTPAALADLPAGWLTSLQRATIKADLDRILTLIDQVRGENAALADALAELARDFEYKKILRLIDRAGEER